jgi:TolA-binding protein
MNSKKFNNSNSNLSRKEIKQYRESRDEKEKFSIELKSIENDFDMDALDGWVNAKSGTQLMTKLDSKFSNKINSKKIYISITILLLSLFFIYHLNSPNEFRKVSKSNKVNVTKKEIENSNEEITEEIMKMIELPGKQQIKIKTIQQDLKAQREETNSTNFNQEKITIETLPTSDWKKIDLSFKPERKQELGKEIYIHDVKLLDYRIYRSRPQIKTKQLIINGTPASQENKNQDPIDISEWKTIDIPYIEFIDETISIFAKGNNKKALTKMEQILENYPDDLNANFYSGICYYNLNEFNKAINAFEKCLSSQFNNFNEEAEWYLAKSFQANNEDEKARILFEKIKNSSSFYSNQVK